MFLYFILLCAQSFCLSGMIIDEESSLLPGNHATVMRSHNLPGWIKSNSDKEVELFYQKFLLLDPVQKGTVLFSLELEKLKENNEKELSKERALKYKLGARQIIFATAYITISHIAHGALCYSKPDLNVDMCSTLYGNSFGSFGLIPACFLTFISATPSERIKSILQKLETEKKELQKKERV